MLRELDAVSPANLAYRALVQARRDGAMEIAEGALRLYRKALSQEGGRRKAVNSTSAWRERLLAARDRFRATGGNLGTCAEILPFSRGRRQA